MLPVRERKQMWWSKGEVKYTVCFALQYSAPSLGQAVTVVKAQWEDKGHQMLNTSTAAFP